MTETEWLACTDLHAMLTYLQGKGTARKWRLCGVACCRRIWSMLPDEACRTAVEASERYADGAVEQREIAIVQSRVFRRHLFAPTAANRRVARATEAAKLVARPTRQLKTIRAAMREVIDAAWAVEATGAMTTKELGSLVRRSCSILCCVFGPLLFRAVPADSAWLTPTITTLATSAYEERSLPSGELDLARLAVLSDALEENDCTDASILEHLRTLGPHVRGCWPVDLLLGKE